MGMYVAEIQVSENEIEEIFDKISGLEREFYNCYKKLQDLGVVRFIKEETSADTDV